MGLSDDLRMDTNEFLLKQWAGVISVTIASIGESNVYNET